MKASLLLRKGREKKETEDKYRDELSEIKQLITALAIKNKKTKPKRPKQVVQIINPPQQEPKKPSPEAEAIRKNILFNIK